MEKFLVSSRFNNQPFQNYIFPQGKRPGKQTVPSKNTIPVIDFDLVGHDRTAIIEQILKASEEFGFFQVINHGVPVKLMDNTMNVVEEFFALPPEEKVRECSRDPKKSCKIYTSSENYNTEEVHCWRDALIHACNPLEECSRFWPGKPSRYREIIGEFTVEARKLSSRILELISEGLKIGNDYSSGGLIENPTLLNNHYPPCPDPSLTLGIPQHRDPSIITLLVQGDVHGLQVLKNGQWIGVEPLPHAFVVNVGYVLQIISNGRLKGAEHRVVTNSRVARTTVTLLILPSEDCLVGPAKSLINADNPSRYRALKFKDFRANFLSNGADDEAVEEFISHISN